jgi:molybdate-binding protein/DNA-binding XRE family transcriptional regulator
MARSLNHPNRVRQFRTSRGWSQAELAGKAGVSRAAVSAVEIERLVPSVSAALAIATAFGSTVEELFGVSRGPAGDPEWAWPPRSSPRCYWQAEVRGRVLRFPAESTAAGTVPHDGLFVNGVAVHGDASDPRGTLILASCDPAAGLLVSEYARTTGLRLIVLSRPSGAALSLLRQGKIHVAGVHFATDANPGANRQAVRNHLETGQHLLHVARWEAGLAVASGPAVRSVGALVRSRLRWVGRQPGSAARGCLDELLAGRSTPRRFAQDHRGVAEAVRSGWADVGVCHRLPCEEAGLRFLKIRVEAYDLCYPAGSESDSRITALIRTVRSVNYRRLIGELPGYDAASAGGVEIVERN